jgi:hypothetical protein
MIDGSMPTLDVISDGRRTGQLKIERFKCRNYEKDVICFGAFLYNQLPAQIRNIKPLRRFQNESKKFLLSKIEVLLRPNQL